MDRRLARLAAILLGGTAVVMPSFAMADTANSTETVIVTATRRAEAVQDVPYNISAYTGGDLALNGAVNTATLSQAIPGLVSLGQTSGNNNNFIMRGLNADKTTDGGGETFATVAPVATYFGETPIFFPLYLTDMDRVEVLRGPQGTLYGSGSLAGTIRFIPHAPNLENYETSGSFTLSGTQNAGVPNGTLEGMVNIPIIQDKLALRIAGVSDYEAGFITNTGLVAFGANGAPVPNVPGNLASGFVVLPPEKDDNARNTEQLRMELGAKITQDLSAQLNYVYQYDHYDNPQETNPDFAGGYIDDSEKNFPGDLFPNIKGVPGGHFWPDGGAVFPADSRYDVSQYVNQPSTRHTNLADLDVTLDLGFASLTSSTSYYTINDHAFFDQTYIDEVSNGPKSPNFAYFYSYYPRFLQLDPMVLDKRADVEEVRLVSTWDKTIDYVFGMYYNDEWTNRSDGGITPGLSQFDESVLPAIGGPFGHNNTTEPDVIYTSYRATQFRDRAIFGELTWHVTSALQVTGGMREFWQSLDAQFVQTLPYCGKPCASNGNKQLGGAMASAGNSVNAPLYKANASYKIDDDLLAYATYSQGFRRGGANAISIGGIYASLPEYLIYKPDKATNYEVGLKGTNILGQTFTADAFYINWNNFQFDGTTPSGFGVVINGSQARSEGYEAELSGKIFDNLTYQGGYTYTQAVVARGFTTYDLPAYAGPKGTPTLQYDILAGNPLPNNPKDTATLSLDYKTQWYDSDWLLLWHLNGAYRSGTQSTFGPTAQKGKGFFMIDPFTTINGSVTLAGNVNWTASLFANNIFNAQGITGGIPVSQAGARGAQYFIETPRTIGIKFTYAE